MLVDWEPEEYGWDDRAHDEVMAALNSEIAQLSRDGSDIGSVRFSPWNASPIVLSRFAAVGDPVTVVFSAVIARDIDRPGKERASIQAIFLDDEKQFAWLGAILQARSASAAAGGRSSTQVS